MDDLIARLRKEASDATAFDGSLMWAWDSWRAAIAAGDQASWPRDEFESWVEHLAELLVEAATALEAKEAGGVG